MYDSESSSEAGWIEWFCDLEGHEFFVAVSIIDIHDSIHKLIIMSEDLYLSNIKIPNNFDID